MLIGHQQLMLMMLHSPAHQASGDTDQLMCTNSMCVLAHIHCSSVHNINAILSGSSQRLNMSLRRGISIVMAGNSRVQGRYNRRDI